MKRKIILLGKGTLAIRVAQWFVNHPAYELTMIVPVVPEPQWTDSLTCWAKKNGIVYLESGNYQDITDVRRPEWKIDMAFSVFYDKIFKDWFIRKCGRILNLHNGPLPRYRGVSPINWALKNNEHEHGVTIHQITPGIDDGPIVSQIKYSIYPEFDEVIDVYKRALEYGWLLFEQTMPMIDKIIPRPQDESRASYYSAGQNQMLGERKNFTRGSV